MINKVAETLSGILFFHYPIEDSKRPIYIYGIELFISTSAAVIFILLLSALFGFFPVAMVFLTVFMSLRSFVGGYHAETYGRCFILTTIVYILVACFAYIISLCKNPVAFIIINSLLSTSSAAVIFVLAPVKNSNHPLSDFRYQNNKRRARYLIFLFLTLLAGLICFHASTLYTSIVSVTITAVAVMMIIPQIKERRT